MTKKKGALKSGLPAGAIESPVKQFPGYIVLPRFLTLDHMVEWDEHYADARQYTAPNTAANARPGSRIIRQDTMALYYQTMLGGALKCLDKIHLDGWPDGELNEHNFPATPLEPAQALMEWIVTSVSNLFVETETIPNG